MNKLKFIIIVSEILRSLCLSYCGFYLARTFDVFDGKENVIFAIILVVGFFSIIINLFINVLIYNSLEFSNFIIRKSLLVTNYLIVLLPGLFSVSITLVGDFNYYGHKFYFSIIIPLFLFLSILGLINVVYSITFNLLFKSKFEEIKNMVNSSNKFIRK